MKKFLSKTYRNIVLVVVGGAFIVGGLIQPAFAQKEIGGNPCAEGGPGNLHGVAMTTYAGPIYMSTQSWNDPDVDPDNWPRTTTNVNFYTSYNRQTGLFGGRGWSPNIGWVDFGYTNQNLMAQKKAEFESPKANPAGWGNMEYTIDLSTVVYQSDPGSFVGKGENFDFPINGGTSFFDNVVGVKYIDFSDVVIAPGECNEHVDVTLNNANVLYQETCNISRPTIRWTSENVSNCQTGIGLWTNPGARPAQNTTGELASGNITPDNTPVTFTVRCVGNDSGAVIIGSAYAWCGDSNGPGGPGGPGGDGPGGPGTGGLVIPDYREV